jgi:hypothetical protein
MLADRGNGFFLFYLLTFLIPPRLAMVMGEIDAGN